MGWTNNPQEQTADNDNNAWDDRICSEVTSWLLPTPDTMLYYSFKNYQIQYLFEATKYFQILWNLDL
jgi:hypothetical protein